MDTAGLFKTDVTENMSLIHYEGIAFVQVWWTRQGIAVVDSGRWIFPRELPAALTLLDGETTLNDRMMVLRVAVTITEGNIVLEVPEGKFATIKVDQSRPQV